MIGDVGWQYLRIGMGLTRLMGPLIDFVASNAGRGVFPCSSSSRVK
jgi:hypothetical protein